MPARPVITLTTDFGLRDPYVGAMKAAILSIAPHANLVDISHLIEAQNIGGAAYVLAAACPYFPQGTIHLAVVDPGVGTARRPIAVQTANATFVGPDNGTFAPVLKAAGAVDVRGNVRDSIAVQLSDPSYWRHPVSGTFHGRDIFGPVAAHLAGGLPIERLGPTISALEPGGQTLPTTLRGDIHGVIVHIDRFGNAVSNVPAAMTPQSPIFHLAGCEIRGLSGTYQDGDLIAIEGSTGLVEIAARNSSAAESLGVRVGDPVIVRPGA